MFLKSILAASLVLGLTAAAACAGTKMFSDSTLVVRDRFSDEIVGQGPDLIFIPGLSSSREVWKATAERLKGGYRLHLIQVAGFAGEAPRANASGPVLVPTAEAIDAYLVAQHLAPATVIGHSLGGTMILYLAEQHPEHMKKVMLVDALPFYSVLMGGPSATAATMAPMADNIRRSTTKMVLNDQMLASMATTPADRANIQAWGTASDTSAVVNATADDLTLDLRPGLGAVTVPVTLVYPDYAPVGQTKGGSQALYGGQYAPLKGIKLVEVENSVHFIMFDQPARLAEALEAFLKE
jgi:pimeloyl-ACP methyl ester carboxylesterase